MAGGKGGNGKAAQNSPGYQGDPLPPNCPPPGVSTFDDEIVVRLVPTDKPTNADFRPSSKISGRVRPKKRCDECRWCSVSVHLYSKATVQRLREMTTSLKNLQHMKFIAHIKVDADSGVAKPWPGQPDHVSFWALNTFSAAAAVEKCEPV